MPVMAVVGGRSAAGQVAATSHTAAAATPLVTQQALFQQAGIIAVPGLGELVEVAALFAAQPLPAGDRVAIVTNAGGAGVLAADACGDNGLRLADLSAPTRRSLARLLPSGATIANPADTTAAVGQDAFRACLEDVAADDGVDAVLAVTVPTAIADLGRAISAAKVAKTLVVAILDQRETVRLLPVGAGEPGRAGQGTGAGRSVQDAGRAAAPRSVPAYAFPESAARALGHAVRYHAWRGRQDARVPEFSGLRAADAKALVTSFLGAHPDGGWLSQALVQDLLGCYQIPLVPSRLVTGEEGAVLAAAQFGGTVVLKAEAAGVVHKTEAGAVKLDLHGEPEVRAAYRDLAGTFGAGLTGVLVQPMVSGGVEMLIGVVQERVFGPLVVFGLGGVATQVLGDHAARLTPLTDADADDLIRSVHAAPLLFGHRGTPPVDTAALTEVLLRVSRLADDLPEVAELDLNPVIATPGGANAVDARVRLSPAQPRDPFLRQLR
jgi:acyl-CoA synthetase (NDP forming)